MDGVISGPLQVSSVYTTAPLWGQSPRSAHRPLSRGRSGTSFWTLWRARSGGRDLETSGSACSADATSSSAFRERLGEAQNVYLSATCTSRGGMAFTIFPNRGLEKSPFTDAGPKNCERLNVLKVSRRNCNAFVSLTRKDLSRARSVLNIAGP